MPNYFASCNCKVCGESDIDKLCCANFSESFCHVHCKPEHVEFLKKEKEIEFQKTLQIDKEKETKNNVINTWIQALTKLCLKNKPVLEVHSLSSLENPNNAILTVLVQRQKNVFPDPSFGLTLEPSPNSVFKKSFRTHWAYANKQKAVEELVALLEQEIE